MGQAGLDGWSTELMGGSHSHRTVPRGPPLRKRRLLLALALSAAGLPLATGALPAQAAGSPGCATGAPPAFFLGIVYDSAVRQDFVLDVGNFERFRSAIGAKHCIEDGASTILAFRNWTHPQTGRRYADGSEANLKAELARLGAAAQSTPGSTFFFFLSSHGMASPGYGKGGCPSPRPMGSYSALLSGAGENGTFHDCELGAALNTHFAGVPAVVAVDCSFCGGFSDSITAASGTVSDGSLAYPSGILAPERIVITGCAITTECFGSDGGGNPYRLFDDVLSDGVAACDGWTGPSFPTVQGVNVAVRGDADGTCSTSELFYAAVDRVNQLAGSADDSVIALQQQFRIKYGPASLAEDIPFS